MFNNTFKTFLKKNPDFVNFDGYDPDEKHDLWSKSSGFYFGYWNPYIAASGLYPIVRANATKFHPSALNRMKDWYK